MTSERPRHDAGAPERITSSDNPRLKAVRRLHERAGRQSTGSVVIEGRRLVAAALAASVPIEALFVTDPDDPLIPQVRRVSLLEPHLLAKIAATQTPQGVVAVAAWRPQAEVPAPAQRVLAFSGIADPGNAGTLIRSAAAFGFDAVVVPSGSCEPTNPKVLRASAGATFTLPVVAGGGDAAAWADRFRSAGAVQVGAAAHGGVDPDTWQAPEHTGVVLWIGGEAHGLDSAVADAISVALTIPTAAGVESLNAAAAGAVLLHALGRA